MREKQVPVDVVEMKGKCLHPALRLSGRRGVAPTRSASCEFAAWAGWPRSGVCLCYRAYVGSRFLCPSQLQSLSLSSCQVKRRPPFFHSHHVICLHSRGTQVQARFHA